MKYFYEKFLLNSQSFQSICRHLLFLSIFLVFGSGTKAQTTYDFSTPPAISGSPYKTTVTMTIGGVSYKISGGINGDNTHVTSGGSGNSPALKKDGAGGENFTISRTDNAKFQFYGLWLKQSSIGSYPNTPPFYTIKFYDGSNELKSYSVNNQNSTDTYTENLTVTHVTVSFNALLTYYLDDLKVGPAAAGVASLNTSITSYSNNSATINGNVTNDNGATVTERGIVWSTSSNPTIANNKVIVGSGTGTYSTTITGLNPLTKYYVRAYAVNSVGTSYGNELNFIPSVLTVPSTLSTFIDNLGSYPNDPNCYVGFNTEYGDSKAVLKFNLSAITGNISSAKLRIYINYITGSNVPVNVWGSNDDSWTGSTNVVPAKITPVLTSSTITAVGGWKELDVTDFIRNEISGNKIATLILDGNSSGANSDFGFNSFNNSLNKPELLIEQSTNNAPTGISLSANSINENVPANSVIGTFSSTDPDAGDTFTYSLVSGTGSADNASFSIVGNSLKILLSPDYETKNTYNIRVRTTDQGGLWYEKTFTININDLVELEISPSSLPAGKIGQNYSQTISASAGAAPYTYIITSGTLPAGLTLSAAGNLTGTPTAGGNFNFTIKATDVSASPGPYHASKTYSLTIDAPSIILPASLSNATVGSSYSQTITATGGTSPYTYTVTPGTLPNGLTLSAAGALTGTPTAGGTFNFTITATDASTGTGPYSASKTYSLIVNPGSQTITFASSGTVAYGDADFAPGATSTNNTIPITYSSSDNSVASIVNNKVHIIKAGTVTIYADQASDASYHAATQKQQTLTIHPKALTATAAAISKSYDGATDANINFGALNAANGLVGTDQVSVTYASAHFDNKNVGSGKAITINGLTLSGPDKNNYSLNSFSATGTITPKDIILSLNTNPLISKMYDNNSSASLDAANYTLNGVLGSDIVSVSGTASYDTKDAGTGKTITANNFVLSGAQKDNYNLITASASTTGNILPKDINLSLNATPLISKVYDTNNNASLVEANYTLNGLLGSDIVSVSGIASYDTKDAGTGKTITANNFVLSGAQKDNYHLTTSSASTTGNITPKDITLSLNASPLISKVYDNSNSASLDAANYSLNGIFSDDAIRVSGTASYDSKDAGIGKTVTANNFVLSGAQKDNYNLTTTSASTNGNITPKDITLSLNANPLISKVYDNISSANLTPTNYTLNGILGSDIVSVSGTASYDSKDAGTGKTITANNFVLSGAQKDNYNLTTTSASTNGNITPKDITLSLNASPIISKVYDNSSSASLDAANYTLNGLLGSDIVNVSGTASYDSKDAGTGKTITANNFVLSGAQKDNYNLVTTSATTIGNILPKDINLSLNATPLISKMYDNNSSASLDAANYTLNGVLGSDIVSVSGTASYDTKDAGTGKTITANNFVLSGAQKDNYNLITASASTTGNILPKDINLSLNATPLISKVYDTNNNASLDEANYTLSGILGSDEVTVSGTASYDSKDAGTGKTITANNFVLSGAQKDNYNLVTTSATTIGNILPKDINLSLNATPLISKVYDTNNNASLVEANYTLNGILGSDIVNVSGTASYDSQNAGIGKTVTATNFVLSGAQKDNYHLSTISASTTGNITPKDITLSLNASPLISKVYDNSNSASLDAANYSLNGIFSDDAIRVSGTASYDSKNAGTGKTVTATNFVLSGAQKDNYHLSTISASTTGNITPKDITLSLNASPLISKVYDNSNSASLDAANYSLNGIFNDDAIRVSGTASYNTKGAGTGKTITANNFVLSGAQKDNYHLTTTSASTTGNITARELTVTADNQSKIQGTVNPPLTFTYQGFANGETRNNLLLEPLISTQATTESPVGDYEIQLSGGEAANYSFVYIHGTLKVLPGAPTNITLSNNSIFENQPAGTIIGAFSSTSDDPNATFTYALVSGAGDNAAFSLSGNQLQTASSFDFESKSSYNILVRSTTQYGLSLDKLFTILVKDVNEAPTLSPIANQAICYTADAQTINLKGISAGPESGQTTVVSISSSNPDVFEHLWVNQNGANGAISYRLKYDASGTANITVTVKDNGGTENGGTDTFSRTFVLTINSLPVIGIQADKGEMLAENTIQISKGETVKLTAKGGVSYSWESNSSIIDGQYTATLTARPSLSTSYRVRVTNANGCSESQIFTVNVLEDYQTVKTTNVLSPNGDEYNDKWVIDNIDVYPNNEVKIFDKSGRLIYSKKGYDNTWNGTLNGVPLAEGTYYYIIDFGDNRLKLKGFITIIKEN